jgi:hypothetical protein
MVYTCYDMMRDCRADRPEGWSCFVSNYAPLVRRILAHYSPDSTDALFRPILDALKQSESPLFVSSEPAPERWFVAELRRQVLLAVDRLHPQGEPALTVDLETLTAALSPLTLVEKQAVWLETMAYNPAETGQLLRMDGRTVEKVRAKGAELLRAKLENWSQVLLTANGRQLSRAAEAASPDCLPTKAFLDILDGRATWYGRESMERHVTACWHCIDHFCRMTEVRELLRNVQPLRESETREILGLPAARKPSWKKLFGAPS